jgi:murein DD-endopeptidase MepM/ murein hydrolase activator NlpD
MTHQAIDIGTQRGTPIISTTNGTVLLHWTKRRRRDSATGCGWDDAGGNIVVIVDDQGYAHYYAHMNREPQVSPGRVVAGQPLGEVGNSGSIADGGPTHLHYQVWVVGGGRDAELASGVFTRPFGRAVNPYSELRRLAQTLGASVGRDGGVILAGRP